MHHSAFSLSLHSKYTLNKNGWRNIHLLPFVCVVWMLRAVTQPPGGFLNNLELLFVTSPICFSCLCQFVGCLLLFFFLAHNASSYAQSNSKNQFNCSINLMIKTKHFLARLFGIKNGTFIDLLCFCIIYFLHCSLLEIHNRFDLIRIWAKKI